jgi:hypothetical protein
MKRSAFVVLATVALVLGLSGVASAGANPSASCSGLASSSRAGDPGAEAAVQFEIQANEEGVPPGIIESEFSRDHLGSAEACLG